MAKGFINVSTSGNGDVSYYSRSQECLYVQSSKNLSKEVPQLLADWKQLEWQEKMGNKELGIRGRHDAQVRKNYTLSLPNELSPQEAARRIEAMIQQTPIKDCSYSIFIHRGQKDGVTNLHAHLLVNERNLTTRKKDRQMIKKEFLEKEFRPRFEKAFASERALGKDLVSRERISTVLFQSSPQAARTLLSDYQQQAKQASEKQALGTLISGYAAAHQAREAVKVAETVPVKSVTPQEPEKVTPVTLEQKWEPAWRAYATELEGRNQRSRDRNGLVDQVAAYLEKNDHPTGVKQVLALKGLPDSLSKELTGKLERYERIQELSRQVKEEQSRLSLKSLNPFLGSKERAAVSAMLAAIKGQAHSYPDHHGYEAASKGSHVKGATYFSIFRERCEEAREPLASFKVVASEHRKAISPIETLSQFASRSEQQQKAEAQRAAIEKARREELQRKLDFDSPSLRQRPKGPRL